MNLPVINFLSQNTRKYFPVFFFIALFGLSLLGCQNNKIDKNFSEGMIEYAITYNDDIPFKFDASIRPQKMVIKFKDNNTLNLIEGLSGGFSFSIVQNFHENKVYNLINFMGKKLCYTEEIQEGVLPYAFSEMPTLTIKDTGETLEFLGLHSSKAVASYMDEDGIEYKFEVIYTEELSINEPNKNSPYQELKGVMLMFTMVSMGQKIELTAQTIKSGKVEDQEFNVTTGYEQVDKEVLDSFFELMQ